MEERYLFPDRLRADVLLREAARHLAREIDWLMVRAEGDHVRLRHGEGAELGTITVHDMAGLPAALIRLEEIVAESGYPLPDELVLDEVILWGAVSALDRPSVLLTGGKLDRFDERLRGVYGGIGVKIEFVEGELRIREVYDGTPAREADLRPGDVILAVDERPTLGMDVSDANRRIRGEVGTLVAIRIRRGAETLTLSIRRAEVPLPNVERKTLPSGVAVVTLRHFSEQSGEGLRAALTALSDEGALGRGLIVDLRGNTGGSMTQAARCADHLLREGLILRTEGRDEAPVARLPREISAVDEGNEPSVPIVVLVDRRTASGSEIMAGALSLLGRAVLVGERTYGKGSVQKLYNLRPGVKLKLTVAEYRLAGGLSVAQQGLSADLAIGRVIFDADGVRMQKPFGAEEARTLYVVDERPGWEKGMKTDEASRSDPELEVAERLLLRATGAWRDELLPVLDQVLFEAKREQDRRLVETSGRGGIDWRPAPTPTDDAPEVDLDIDVRGTAMAGENLTLCASVTNRGVHPAWRATARVWSENPFWDGLFLPLGHIAGGASAESCRVLKVPTASPTRADEVTLALHLDGQPSPPPVRRTLIVEGRPSPTVTLRGQVVPFGDHLQVRLDVRNAGRESLRDIKLRLTFPEDEAIRLLDPDAFLPLLPPGEERRADLDVEVRPDFSGTLLPLGLEIETAGHGRIATWDLPLPLDGRVSRHEAPQIGWRLPTQAPSGRPLSLSVRATDEGGVGHVVVFGGDEKLLYRRGGSRRVDADLSFVPQAGSNRLEAVARDPEGHVTRSVAWILGIPQNDEPNAEAP
jgi:carboxyl-terminal processing protease